MTMQYVFSQLQGSTVETLFWDTFIQGTPPFRGHKIWSGKNVHIIFIFVTSIEGTPLFKGKGTLFLEPPSRRHFSTQKVTYHKNG